MADGVFRKGGKRALIFNCTSGRSGESFLETMLKIAAEQLQLYGSEETSDALFDAAIFCTNITYADGHFKGGVYFVFYLSSSPPSTQRVLIVLSGADLTSRAIETADTSPVKIQSELASGWKSLIPEFPTDNIHVLPSVEHAIRVVRGIESEAKEGGVDVLVAGSLHLVGGVIEVAGLGDVAL